jgi:two-component system NtrC family sensor kinase
MSCLRRQRSFIDWVKSHSSSLGLSLFLWLFGVIIVAFAAYAWVSVRTSAEHWNQTVLACAERFSDLIRSSTHYGMLLNRKQDVHQIIETVAREPGVEGVRIYDKNGVIIFSAVKGEIGQTVDMQAEACVICHEQTKPLQSVPKGNQVRVYGERDTGRILGLIEPIPNLPECSSADCHAHPPDQTVLGVLDVKMSMAQADATLASATRQLIAAAVLTALLVGMAAALFIYRVVRRPVRDLIDGTKRIANGDLETTIAANGRDEMGQLAHSFNKMTGDLREAREELTRWSDKLETSLMEKTTELNRTQRHVVHMEKMASLGKLAATVAHELNNPLAGILNYAKLVDRSLNEGKMPEDERTELQRCLGLIQKEAARCGDTVRNLLLFARQSGAELALVPLNSIIERSLMLVHHHLEMSGVHLETTLFEEGADQVVCDGNQIQQALLALMVNAVEAMPHGGTLSVRAIGRDSWIAIAISDTGTGIPPVAIPHIFEPFFSTKDEAEGVGLGLAVAYGIIQRHGGDLEVESQLDHGTTFTVTLPKRPPMNESAKREKRHEQLQPETVGQHTDGG